MSKGRPEVSPALAPLDVAEDARRPKRWVWGLLALALVGLAAWVWRARSQAQEPANAYETTPVAKRDIVSKVTATGTLSALVTVQVGSQVSGRVQEILVDFNSQVKKGQVIARIDPQLSQSAVERARANTTAARANLQKARVEADISRRQAERSRALREKQFISQAELDTAEASALSAQAQVGAAEGSLAQAQASLNEAEVNLRYTTIVSPTDGIVISRSVDVGQTVAASLQAPTLFTIAEDLRKMQVNTSVSESDVGRLQPGMRATFTVDAWSGERFEGTVRQIRNAAQTVQNVVTYDAVIDLENPDLKLKPGMTANVTIVTAERKDVPAIPNAALRFRPPTPAQAPGAPQRPQGERAQAPEGSRVLWVLREGRPAPARVQLGLTDGSLTEVASGELREGDAVITGTAGGTQSTATQGASAPGGFPGGGARPGGGMRRGPF
ncbi:efflux RND transporter periplasmic adaptor subunit [Myxococcaceae bacterium GXIMD 01537]